MFLLVTTIFFDALECLKKLVHSYRYPLEILIKHLDTYLINIIFSYFVGLNLFPLQSLLKLTYQFHKWSELLAYIVVHTTFPEVTATYLRIGRRCNFFLLLGFFALKIRGAICSFLYNFTHFKIFDSFFELSDYDLLGLLSFQLTVFPMPCMILKAHYRLQKLLWSLRNVRKILINGIRIDIVQFIWRTFYFGISLLSILILFDRQFELSNSLHKLFHFFEGNIINTLAHIFKYLLFYLVLNHQRLPLLRW